MYTVFNKSKSELNISDLKIVIPPKQGRDLDKLPLPMNARKSKDLAFALKKGYLKEISRDDDKKQIIKEIIREKEIIKQPSQIDQEALLATIRDEIRKNQVPQPVAQSGNEPLLSGILKKMNTLVNNGGVNIAQSKEEDSFDGLDEQQIVEIHKKTMKKLAKDTETSIDYEQSNSKDESMSNDIDELSGLI